MFTLFLSHLENYSTADARNLSQILFFVIMATIAFLSYQAAKKSIFSSQKNEIFKRQIEELDTLHKLCYISNDIDFLKKFDFYGCCLGTTESAHSFIHRDLKSKDKLDVDLKNMYHTEDIAPYFIKTDFINKEFEIEGLFRTNKHMNQLKAFKELQKSTLMPGNIEVLIGGFLYFIEKLYPLAINALNTQMLSIYENPNADLRSSYTRTGWVAIMHSKEIKDCIDTSAEIRSEIKKYLKIDEIVT